MHVPLAYCNLLQGELLEWQVHRKSSLPNLCCFHLGFSCKWLVFLQGCVKFLRYVFGNLIQTWSSFFFSPEISLTTGRVASRPSLSRPSSSRPSSRTSRSRTPSTSRTPGSSIPRTSGTGTSRTLGTGTSTGTGTGTSRLGTGTGIGRTAPVRTRTTTRTRQRWRDFGTWQVAGTAGYLYGYNRYINRRRYRIYPNDGLSVFRCAEFSKFCRLFCALFQQRVTDSQVFPFTEPTICQNNLMYQRDNGTYYNYFICPLDDEDDSYVYCCYDPGAQICCTNSMWSSLNTQQGGNIEPVMNPDTSWSNVNAGSNWDTWENSHSGSHWNSWSSSNSWSSWERDRKKSKRWGFVLLKLTQVSTSSREMRFWVQ